MSEPGQRPRQVCCRKSSGRKAWLKPWERIFSKADSMPTTRGATNTKTVWSHKLQKKTEVLKPCARKKTKPRLPNQPVHTNSNPHKPIHPNHRPVQGPVKNSRNSLQAALLSPFSSSPALTRSKISLAVTWPVAHSSWRPGGTWSKT